MDELSDLIGQAVATEPAERLCDETKPRVAAIGRLFVQWREQDVRLADSYVFETLEIPLWVLGAAVSLLIRAHPYPRLPSVADLWRVAREYAGMNREQYTGGRYIKPSTEWPPEGKCHAVPVGEYEDAIAPHMLSTGEISKRLGPGEELS